MNLTEQYRAITLEFIRPSLLPPNKSSVSGWKGYALCVTVFAVGFGIYVLLLRRKGSSGRRWNIRRSQRTQADKPNDNSCVAIKELGDDTSIVTYNGEVCPICLCTPKIGVKATCGHLLCAECLASYCDVRITPAPPPCPLCRAPLNSVALACDFTILSPKMLDPNTVIVQNWIREYNSHRGLVTSVRPFFTTRLALFFNILTLFLIIGLIAARLQVLTEI